MVLELYYLIIKKFKLMLFIGTLLVNLIPQDFLHCGDPVSYHKLPLLCDVSHCTDVRGVVY